MRFTAVLASTMAEGNNFDDRVTVDQAGLKVQFGSMALFANDRPFWRNW